MSENAPFAAGERMRFAAGPFVGVWAVFELESAEAGVVVLAGTDRYGPAVPATRVTLGHRMK
jgi:hypothetical protein